MVAGLRLASGRCSRPPSQGARPPRRGGSRAVPPAAGRRGCSGSRGSGPGSARGQAARASSRRQVSLPAAAAQTVASVACEGIRARHRYSPYQRMGTKPSSPASSPSSTGTTSSETPPSATSGFQRRSRPGRPSAGHRARSMGSPLGTLDGVTAERSRAESSVSALRNSIRSSTTVSSRRIDSSSVSRVARISS